MLFKDLKKGELFTNMMTINGDKDCNWRDVRYRFFVKTSKGHAMLVGDTELDEDVGKKCEFKDDAVVYKHL